jgi:hypothetical protein
MGISDDQRIEKTDFMDEAGPFGRQQLPPLLPRFCDHLIERAARIEAGDKLTAIMLRQAATEIREQQAFSAKCIATWMGANDQLREAGLVPRYTTCPYDADGN